MDLLNNAIKKASPFFEQLGQGVLITSDDKVIYKNDEFSRLLEAHAISPNDFIWRVYDGFGIDRANIVHTSGDVLVGLRRVYVTVLPVDGNVMFLTSLSSEASDPFSQFPETMSAIGGKCRLPLSLMVSSLGLISNRLKDCEDEKMSRFLGILNHNFYRLFKLSNNLNTLARLKSGAEPLRAVSVDVVKFIDGIIDPLFTHAAGLGIDMSFEYSFDCKLADIDPEKIELAIYNLLANSFKYIGKDPRVMIRISGGEEALFISVSDNGSGIPEAVLPHVFTKYIIPGKNDRPEQGLGVGLSIVKAVCELHKGSVVLKSAQEKGTTVTISLPVKQERASHFYGQSTLDIDYAGGFSHVLLEFCDVLPTEAYMLR